MHFDNDRRGTSPLSDIAELTPDARHYSTHHSHPQQPPVQMPVPQHPLQSLLEDFDFAAFTSVYAKKYEEDLVKWQKCASEEWEANASGLRAVVHGVVECSPRVCALQFLRRSLLICWIRYVELLLHSFT